MLENFRPGVMEQLGLGIDHVRAVNPEIVYVSVSGFGQTGPLRDRAAVNLVIEAASGSLSVTGEPGEIPMRPGVQTGDMFGAMFATYAALAGLMGKVRYGEGRQIDVSLVEASIAAAVWETSEYLATGNVPQPLGHKHRLTAPYQVFQASDGLLVIGCPNDQLFFKIMKVLGLAEAAKDPRFATYGSRKANERALLDAIEPAVALRQVGELVQALSALGVPCSKVNSYKDVFDNEHARQRKIEIEGVHRRAGLGSHGEECRAVRQGWTGHRPDGAAARRADRRNPVPVRLCAGCDPADDRRESRRSSGGAMTDERSVDEEPVVPAGEPREISGEGAALDADGFIVDFEDSVPAAEKAAARKNLATYAPALRGKSIWVRPNAPDTPHFEEDLAAICKTPASPD